MFCAGFAIMQLFSVMKILLLKWGQNRRFGHVIYIFFWISAAYLFYEFAYFGAYGCISWYGLGAFGCGMILWKKIFCGIMTLYDNAQKRDGDTIDEKKNKGASS